MRAIVRALLARAPFGSEIFLGRFFKITISLSLCPKFPNSSFLGKFKFLWDEDRIRSNWFAWRDTIDDDETLIQTERCSRVSQRDSGSRPRPRERRVNSKNRGGKTEESIYYTGVSGTELTWRIVNRSALDVSAIGSRGGKLYRVITYLVFDPVSDSLTFTPVHPFAYSICSYFLQLSKLIKLISFRALSARFEINYIYAVVPSNLFYKFYKKYN